MSGKAENAKRLKELERENAKLKRVVAEQLLENQALKEIARGNWLSPSRRREAVLMLQERLSLSERRACRITSQHRSTQRHQPRSGDRMRRCGCGCDSSRERIRAGAIGAPERRCAARAGS